MHICKDQVENARKDSKRIVITCRRKNGNCEYYVPSLFYKKAGNKPEEIRRSISDNFRTFFLFLHKTIVADIQHSS